MSGLGRLERAETRSTFASPRKANDKLPSCDASANFWACFGETSKVTAFATKGSPLSGLCSWSTAKTLTVCSSNVVLVSSMA